MQLTRIKNDINGNGRFVVHFLDLVTHEERSASPEQGRIPWLFERALARSKKIGGRRYRGSDFGGGIAFQECGEELLRQDILNLLKGASA
jgi:hypothetical protein